MGIFKNIVKHHKSPRGLTGFGGGRWGRSRSLRSGIHPQPSCAGFTRSLLERPARTWAHRWDGI